MEGMVMVHNYGNKYVVAGQGAPGKPAGECRCKLGRINNGKFEDHYQVVDNDLPEPLGLPVMNFDNDEPADDEHSSLAVANARIGRGDILGLPEWSFERDTVFADNVAKAANSDDTPTPLGLPEWSF